MVSEVNNSLTGVQTAGNKQLPSAQPNPAGVVARSAEGDTGNSAQDSVILTEAATRLQRLAGIIAQAPQVDQQRVEQLRQSIAERSYQVDDQRVADRFIRFETAVAVSSYGE